MDFFYLPLAFTLILIDVREKHKLQIAQMFDFGTEHQQEHKMKEEEEEDPH